MGDSHSASNKTLVNGFTVGFARLPVTRGFALLHGPFLATPKKRTADFHWVTIVHFRLSLRQYNFHYLSLSLIFRAPMYPGF